MEIKKIVDYINRGYIASDYLREPDVYYFMDMVIDDINERLQATFPTFSEWGKFVEEWNALVSGPNVRPDDDHGAPQPVPPSPPIPAPNISVDKPHYINRLPIPPRPPRPMDPARMLNYNPMATRWPCFYLPRMYRPDLLRDNTKYDAFPDEYLRTVVALGVAVKFYTRDEEGEQIALDYQNRYEQALFKMVRDYHNQVPWYFRDERGGFIDFSYNREFDGPWDLVPRGMVLRGEDTKIL